MGKACSGTRARSPEIWSKYPSCQILLLPLPLQPLPLLHHPSPCATATGRWAVTGSCEGCQCWPFLFWWVNTAGYPQVVLPLYVCMQNAGTTSFEVYCSTQGQDTFFCTSCLYASPSLQVYRSQNSCYILFRVSNPAMQCTLVKG